MKHSYIEDHNLVERYVQGRLSTDEQVRFEEHFAECDACMSELELADDFASALKVAVVEETRQVAAAGWVGHLIHGLRGPRAAILLGTLVAALAMPVLWLVTENQKLHGALGQMQKPRADGPSYLLTVARDAETPALDIPRPAESAAWWSLAVEVEDTGPETLFQVRLIDADGTVWWQDSNLEANLWNVLQVTLPRTFLPAGTYRLQVETLPGGTEGTAASTESYGSYVFRLVEP